MIKIPGCNCLYWCKPINTQCYSQPQNHFNYFQLLEFEFLERIQYFKHFRFFDFTSKNFKLVNTFNLFREYIVKWCFFVNTYKFVICNNYFVVTWSILPSIAFNFLCFEIFSKDGNKPFLVDNFIKFTRLQNVY